MAKKLGYVSFFDNTSGEGYIRDSKSGHSFYVHYSAIQNQKGFKKLFKNQPVRFTLYENLYMSQVDSCEVIEYGNIKAEHDLNSIANDLFDMSDCRIIDIYNHFYKNN